MKITLKRLSKIKPRQAAKTKKLIVLKAVLIKKKIV